MLNAVQIRSSGLLLCCAILSLITLTLLVACHSGEQAQDQGLNEKNVGSATSEPETHADGLLELELIGYTNAIGNFTEIDTSRANEMIDSNEEFFIFIGRPTCEWCRKVAPSLQEAASSIGVEVFYLDSTDSESDELLADFRARYEVETVPAVLHFRHEGDYVTLDVDVTSDTLRDDLRQLLKDEAS